MPTSLMLLGMTIGGDDDGNLAKLSTPLNLPIAIPSTDRIKAESLSEREISCQKVADTFARQKSRRWVALQLNFLSEWCSSGDDMKMPWMDST